MKNYWTLDLGPCSCVGALTFAFRTANYLAEVVLSSPKNLGLFACAQENGSVSPSTISLGETKSYLLSRFHRSTDHGLSNRAPRRGAHWY